jgi:cyclophilin family peptidyl-prolyl cis-trans isomerase
VGAVEFTLVTNTLTLPVGTTFQMPVTATDAQPGPLQFKVESVSWRAVQAAFASPTNRSLRLDITGVDSNETPFVGTIVLQLFEDLAPRTTARIIELVQSHFYDGLIFHRIVPDFVCQTGDPTGTGQNGSGLNLDDEYHPTLQYTGFGQLGLAKSAGLFGTIIDDSGDSQIFITDVDLAVDTPEKPSPRSFDFKYPLFGQVTRGFDIVDKLINTPVNNESPIHSNILQQAAIIADPHAAVLRLTALRGFTGDVTVVISATNAQKQKATQALRVRVVANPINTPPFLGPLPASLLITQAMAASFPLTVTDLDDDDVNLRLLDDATQNFPTNVQAFLDSRDQLWLLPDLTFTGTTHLVLGVTDYRHPYDSQKFTLTIEPAPAAPTFNIIPRSGKLVVSPQPLRSSVKLAGRLDFTTDSDRQFTRHDHLILRIGDPAAPVTLTILPTAGGRQHKGGRVRVKTIPGAIPTLAGDFDSAKGAFKIALSNFNFPAALTNSLIEVSLTIGNDYGSNITAWTQSKPGLFTYPKP